MKREQSIGKRVTERFDAMLDAVHQRRYAIRHALRTVFILVCLLVSLSGCWDLTEVDRRDFVTTMGVDAKPSGETLVTIQIPLPQRMLPSSAAGRGNVQGKQFSTASITARTANEALNILQAKTYYELVIEQNKSIIIGEAAARRGLKPLLEYFIRNPKAPPQALIFVAHHHTAAEVLSFTPIQETLPGLQFIGAAQTAAKYDRTYFTSVGQFESRAVHTATDAFAPLIDLDQQEGLYLEAGLAVFDGFHLAGELDMEETQLYGLLSGLMKAGNLTFSLPDHRILSLRNVNGRARIQVNTSGQNRPFFTVQVKINGSLSELADERKEIKPARRRQLELALQKVLAPKISKVIEKLQAFKSDIINFGEEFRVQHLEQWKKQQWKQIFPQVRFKVIVKAKIERDGALR